MAPRKSKFSRSRRRRKLRHLLRHLLRHMLRHKLRHQLSNPRKFKSARVKLSREKRFCRRKCGKASYLDLILAKTQGTRAC